MWLYDGQELSEVPEGKVAFVYLITNLSNNRKYVGKKKFFTFRTKTIKGKRKKVTTESDWKDYYGSNDFLKEDIEKLGKENFKREILHFCENIGLSNYLELREQIDRRVLESDDYYNYWIKVTVHQKHIKNL